MKTALIAPTAIAAAIAVAAILPANAETRSFNLSGFDKISASAGTNVVIRQGPFSVQASQNDGKFDRLKLETQGSTLVIGRKETAWSWFDWGGPSYTVTVSLPSLTELHASSGSDVDAGNLNLAALEVHVSSGADVQLSGQCATLNVHVSSGADFNGKNLRCESATVNASSGADADVFAAKVARGDASSGGNITFHGNPADFDKDTSSGGSVHKTG
jgi:hypothetical protein